MGTIVAGGPVLANLQSIKMKKRVISHSKRRISGVLLLVLVFFKVSIFGMLKVSIPLNGMQV